MRPLRIGLVNNLPDAAMEAAERQFLALMQAASDGRAVELAPFALDGVARGEAGRTLAARYRPAAAIGRRRLDALIVTGAEPRATRLQDEPFWDAFADLLGEAEALGLPVLFSCLAAHAAVLHRDGIVRRPLRRKRSGVFAFAAGDADRLLAGVGRRWTTPHSRWNDLDEGDLREAGYAILGRGADAGVDAFAARVGGARWLFLQGHPEYEARTLLAETRRDLQRYLDGERATPPDPPYGLFEAGDPGEAALAGLLAQASRRPTPDLIDRWSSWAAPVAPRWRSPASALCRNWLASADPELGRDRRTVARAASAPV